MKLSPDLRIWYGQGAESPAPLPGRIDMSVTVTPALIFDCFGTLLHIRAPRNPWKALLADARRNSGSPKLAPRRDPIPTIEAFAAACGALLHYPSGRWIHVCESGA